MLREDKEKITEEENIEKVDASINNDIAAESDVVADSEDFPKAEETIKLKNGKEIRVPKDKNKWLTTLVSALLIVVSALFGSISAYCFIAPNGFAVGGLFGVGIMLGHITGINLGWFSLAINVPLIIVAFFFLSKRFAVMTTSYIVLYSLFSILIEQVDKLLGGSLVYIDSGTPIIAAIVGGVLGGFSFVLMSRTGGTQGGTDIIAAILQKKRPDISITWIIFFIDSVIVLAAFFVYNNGLLPIFLAVIEMFSKSAVADKFLKGSKSALKVEIVTDYPEEISAEIIQKLARGITVVESHGAYTGKKHSLLNCVIKRRQVAELERIIKKYPDTFSYIIPANEVLGRWRK